MRSRYSAALPHRAARPFKAVLLSILFLAAPASYAQSDRWQPDRNVEIIVGVSPGGGIDRTARMAQKIMRDAHLLPVTTTVVNKPGGGGTIAEAYLNQHAGDGHYFQITATSLLTNHIIGKSPHSFREFTPIAMLYDEYIGFAVRADSPLKSGRDLIETFRRDPAALPIGIASSAGNTNHIAVGLVAQAAGADPRKLKVVVFSSGGKAMTALLGGHVGLVVTPSANTIRHLQSGKMRVLAIAAPQRLVGALSAIPTWREQGVDAVVANWRPIIGPKKLGAGQVAYWEGVFGKLSATPQWRDPLEKSGAVIHFLKSRELEAYFEAQDAQFRRVLSAIGLAR